MKRQQIFLVENRQIFETVATNGYIHAKRDTMYIVVKRCL